MIANESYNLDIYGDDTFRLAKFLSVSIAIIIIQISLCYTNVHPGKSATRFLTHVTYLFFVVNILEASAVSFTNLNKPSYDGVNDFPEVNLLLGIVSVIMVVSLCITWFNEKKQIEMNLQGDQLMLNCNFSTCLILSYTFWNLGFKIQEIESPLVLMYFVVSLLLPVVTHYMGIGDWLQVRGLTLLFAIIVELGLAKGETTIFPAYNKIGYDQNQTENSSLSKFFGNRDFKIFLVVMSMLTVCGSLFNLKLPHLEKTIPILKSI